MIGNIEITNSFNAFFVSIGPVKANNNVSTTDSMSYVTLDDYSNSGGHPS